MEGRGCSTFPHLKLTRLSLSKTGQDDAVALRAFTSSLAQASQLSRYEQRTSHVRRHADTRRDSQ